MHIILQAYEIIFMYMKIMRMYFILDMDNENANAKRHLGCS